MEEDMNNPLKQDKLLVSGRITKRIAEWLAFIIFNISIVIIYLFNLNKESVYIILLLLLIDCVYSNILRKYKVLDVAFISFKYPLRLLIGYVLLSMYPDMNLMMSLFFLSGIMVVMKREGEKFGLQGMKIPSRYVLMKYSENMLDNLFLVYYALFSFFILQFHILQDYLMSIPVIILLLSVILVFYSDIDYKKSKSLAILKDKGVILLGIIYFIVMVYTLYG